MTNMLVRILGLILIVQVALASGPGRAENAPRPLGLEPEQISFVYQSNVEPWDRYACKHEKSTVGVHEWDVYCKVGTVVHRYGVHLVLSFYTKTVHGGSAYEMLYWVTDWTGTRPASDSTTLWFHQREIGAKAVVIEAAQGIENDLSSLRLLIRVGT